jgi:hypothetical protein
MDEFARNILHDAAFVRARERVVVTDESSSQHASPLGS